MLLQSELPENIQFLPDRSCSEYVVSIHQVKMRAFWKLWGLQSITVMKNNGKEADP